MANLECTLPRPDIAELHSQLTAEFSKRLLGGAPVLPMSTEDILSFVMAGAVSLMFGAVSQAMRETDPATACCDNLIAYGAKHGMDIHAATRAKGYVAITGTPGAAIPTNIRFVGASSREYKLDPGVLTNPAVLDSTGHATLRIVAAISGAAFNVPNGQTLTIATTTPDIDMQATVVGNGLAGGDDDEDCETYRQRVLDAERSDVVVTNEQWFLREAAKYPGVTRVCTDECACADPAYITIYPFMEGVYGDVNTAPYGVPPQPILDEMTQWMFGACQGHGQGLAPLGNRGVLAAAQPTVMNVTAQCLLGCPSGAEDRVRAALINYTHDTYCVGATVCKEQVRTAINQALGAEPCLGSIAFTFDNTLRAEDDANAYLACAHFLVVGTVTFPT